MMQYEFTEKEQQDKKNFQQATALCMWLYQNPKYLAQPSVQDYVRQLKADLEDIWFSLCQLYEARLKGWTADAGLKGYLIINSLGSMIRVPYHLAEYFPNGEALDELCRIASLVKTSTDGVICISGSSTYLEALKYIADIDYCEYAPWEKNDGWRDGFANVLHESLKKQDNRLICMQGITFNSERKRIYTISHDETLGDNTHLSHGRLDFITLFLEKVIEVTNLVLPIDMTDSKVDPALENSFALQEAPISEGAWIPQQLLNPLSLGRYANFLSGEVQKKQAEEPVKAAKRALSLARITGFWEEGDSIISVLIEGDLTRSAALEACKKLDLEKLRQRNPEVAGIFLRKHRETLQSLSSENVPQISRDDSIKMLKGIFDKLLKQIQDSIEQVKLND